MSLHSQTQSPAYMSPVVKTESPVNILSAKKAQKNNARKKRKREREEAVALASKHGLDAEDMPEDIMPENTKVGEPNRLTYELKNKINLAALTKRTQELEGYVNQIQDAVTIGMYQLRDLKKQVAAATAALETADK
ncbi:hypothetical protein NUW58_g613 [Xylaria curta]|uniref:Uncharacterized protein n=1 Tax=Xylaria curta TaxID=42375 RepID=A0ACC1PPK4_9PEZI|nr:hypothetical protein NUW58_g613 [Xylaria curta]